jgi:hypothetical protein
MTDAKTNLAELDRIDLNRIFEVNQVPFILIAPDREFHVLPQNLITEYSNSEYLPPKSLSDETKIRIENLIRRSKREGFTFFDDILGRVNDVSVQADRLVLKFSKTRYFHFAALNKGLDRPLVSMSGSTTLRDFLNENPYELHSSMLPNPLGVVVSLVLEPENRIVLTIHSNRNFEGTGKIAAAIGGSLSINECDIDFSGLPDPSHTIVREANEELGLNVSRSDIKFFGLGRDLVTLKPELIGEIRLDLREKEVRQTQKHHSKDDWEIESIFVADREEIPKFLSKKNWSPSAWASTYLSVMENTTDH